MQTVNAPRSTTKHKLIDLLSWLTLGSVLLFSIRLIGRFSLDPAVGNVSAGNEGKAMLELMCFVAGLSAILVGISHVFSKEFRDETVILQTAVAIRLERRHHRHGRVGLLMILGLAFSAAGLVALLLPIDSDQKMMSPVLSLLFVMTFTLMTLITASGAALTLRRQRRFDRRRKRRWLG